MNAAGCPVHTAYTCKKALWSLWWWKDRKTWKVGCWCWLRQKESKVDGPCYAVCVRVRRASPSVVGPCVGRETRKSWTILSPWLRSSCTCPSTCKCCSVVKWVCLLRFLPTTRRLCTCTKNRFRSVIISSLQLHACMYMPTLITTFQNEMGVQIV